MPSGVCFWWHCVWAWGSFIIAHAFSTTAPFKEMGRVLKNGEEDGNGITPFQAFATTVGARVGMGNIAGVASAIFYGGPGAIFWMWIIAIIGAASAFTESTLAQAYKVRHAGGEFVGGPAYYIERGLKCKPYAILFCRGRILGTGRFDAGSPDQLSGNGF